MFHTFPDALDRFIKKSGYTGDMEDIAGKVFFVKSAFEQAEIPVPRGMKEWYAKGKGISRTTAFQICFAFGLGSVHRPFVNALQGTLSVRCMAAGEHDSGVQPLAGLLLNLPQKS